MLITPSEVVRRQAIERFRVHPGRVVTVPLADAIKRQRLVPPTCQLIMSARAVGTSFGD